ncbi:PIN-like domain-containing protein [Streptomyces tamarix]|uniref:PIN-like domain-containing protein n=1 Tax=Streptomyces tamarix TaxID=3078565 RepID=UPI0037047795
MEPGTADAEGRGLFDDFGAFRSPTTEDFTVVLRGGLVVPDANVLLNLYRYTEQARTDLLEALAALEDRVWVPHQILAEFWRNRESTIGDARSSGTKAAHDMTDHSAQAVRTLRTWANRVALPDEEFELLSELLACVFDCRFQGAGGLARRCRRARGPRGSTGRIRQRPCGSGIHGRVEPGVASGQPWLGGSVRQGAGCLRSRCRSTPVPGGTAGERRARGRPGRPRGALGGGPGHRVQLLLGRRRVGVRLRRVHR